MVVWEKHNKERKRARDEWRRKGRVERIKTEDGAWADRQGSSSSEIRVGQLVWLNLSRYKI